MPPKLRNVTRLDSLPLNQTFYTSEGYLKDRPILTSTGIFEYGNPDGSIRRELRLPEDVFDPESLASYEGKPIIITHDAGLVTKDNVHEFQIGTILTEGYRSGDDVRAKIIIHNTDEMKDCGLKELSLGYNLDLDETPGEWNGEHYDAIQKNIRINHLALVHEARAGEQARLNIDNRDSALKGGKMMSKIRKKTNRADGVLSSEELAKAIEEYKARRAQHQAEQHDADENTEVKPEATAPAVAVEAKDGEENAVAPAGTETSVEEKVQAIKETHDNEEEPQDLEAAKQVITNQDDDIEMLFDIIDTLLAERAFDEAGEAEATEGQAEATDVTAAVDGKCMDEEDVTVVESEENEDEDEEATPAAQPNAEEKTEVMNADSIDYVVRERIKLGMLGQQLNLDGLENMSIMTAKKAVIKAVRPSVRLDGKSKAYVNAMFDCAAADIQAKTAKGVEYQKHQMFNKDSRSMQNDSDSSENARQRMIERRQKNA